MLRDRECAFGEFILVVDLAGNGLGLVYSGTLYLVSRDDPGD